MSFGTPEPGAAFDKTMPRLPAESLLAPTMPRIPVAVKDHDAMNDPEAQTQRLIDQSIKGTQWIMVAIVIGVPLGLLTNILIARIDSNKTDFGIYSLLYTVLVSMVQTFFLFGGANVIVNFIPRASPSEKSAFMLSYIGIAAIFSAIFFGVMFAFPQLLRFLIISDHGVNLPTIYGFLLLFIPLVIAQTLTIAVLQGEMELAAAARTQYGVQVMSFILAVLAVFVIIPRHILPGQTAVALVVIGAYLISFVNGFLTLQRVLRHRWQWSLRWYLPRGFWRFTGTFHIHTIVTFFFTNIDQLFILYYFSATPLAGTANIAEYRAAVVVATYALWAPNLFTGAMYPFFTNLVAQGKFDTLKGAYQRYSAITGVVVAAIGLVVGLFAQQVLSLFGKNYADALPLMIVASLMYVVVASSAYVPTAALITAHEDIWINLTMNFVSFLVRFGLYFPLVSNYGLLGIAISNAISLAVLHMGTLLIVGVRYHVAIPLRQHLVSVVGVLLLGIFYAFPLVNHPLRLGEAVVLLLVFIVIVSQLRLVSRDDLVNLSNRLGPLKFLKRLLPA